MDELFTYSHSSETIQNIPRTYGTEDILYLAEVHMIRDIAHNEGITPSQLAKMQGRSKSAISQLLDKLIEKELIYKGKHPEGNKKIALFVTEKGKIVNNFHRQLDLKEYSSILSGLSQYSDEDFLKMINFLKYLSPNSEKALKMKKKLYGQKQEKSSVDE